MDDMKRHQNKWINTYDDEGLDMMIRVEQSKGHARYGNFGSWHGLYGVIMEEVCEFFDSIRENNPDPQELLQICAVAREGILQLCALGRQEIKK